MSDHHKTSSNIAAGSGLPIGGSCLCSRVRFQLNAQPTPLYQCHCSTCRKSSGSAGIAMCLSRAEDFCWLSGSQRQSIFIASSGYRAVFCRQCGSPVPDPNPEQSLYWVPVGLLEDSAHLQVGAHIYTDSKAHWASINPQGERFAQGFSAAGWSRLLQSKMAG